MARTTTFTRTDENGRKHTKVAHTPAEAVQLRFDGWREVAEPPKNPKPESTPTTK